MAESGTGTRSGAKGKRAPKGGARPAATADDTAHDTAGPAAAPTQPPPHVCSVAFCPIGMALTSIQSAGPEVLDHLLAAAREFLLAARAVVDARAADFEDPKAGGGLEKIEIG